MARDTQHSYFQFKVYDLDSNRKWRERLVSAHVMTHMLHLGYSKGKKEKKFFPLAR
jgi:hypothetical protein